MFLHKQSYSKTGSSFLSTSSLSYVHRDTMHRRKFPAQQHTHASKSGSTTSISPDHNHTQRHNAHTHAHTYTHKMPALHNTHKQYIPTTYLLTEARAHLLWLQATFTHKDTIHTQTHTLTHTSKIYLPASRSGGTASSGFRSLSQTKIKFTYRHTH
jgi:hypothetical protein